MDVADGATITTIVETLGLPTGLARLRVVNGALVDPEYSLNAGDDLLLAPAASGGTM